MKIERVRASGLLLAAAIVSISLRVAAEELFYRYENVEGVTVIDDHVPPELAYKGYSVLNRSGRVLEVVPRALSEAERRDPNGPAVKARLAAEDRERQQRFDRALLKRYSAVADIEAARTRKLNEIKVRINLLKGGIATQREQLEKTQEEAAGFEREGQSVPAELPAAIASLREEIAKTEGQIAQHEKELAAAELRFELEIARFKVLRPAPASGGA